jgi:hypothetical protein
LDNAFEILNIIEVYNDKTIIDSCFKVIISGIKNNKIDKQTCVEKLFSENLKYFLEIKFHEFEKEKFFFGNKILKISKKLKQFKPTKWNRYKQKYI